MDSAEHDSDVLKSKEIKKEDKNQVDIFTLVKI